MYGSHYSTEGCFVGGRIMKSPCHGNDYKNTSSSQLEGHVHEITSHGNDYNITSSS